VEDEMTKETFVNEVNVENMLALADLIERCDSFDLSSWGRYVNESVSPESIDASNECGTVCCIGGWENVRIGTKRDEYIIEKELADARFWGVVTPEKEEFIRNKIAFDNMSAAAESLGLDSFQVEALFFRMSDFWTRVSVLEHNDTLNPWYGDDRSGTYWQPDAAEAADVLRRIARNELQLVTDAERQAQMVDQ
jgi:hypothetical protein